MLTSCDNGDSGGTSGGGGDYPQVSFVKEGSGDDEHVICYNANNNVITTQQVCTWNCATYNSTQPRFVQLTFDEALVCVELGIDEGTGEVDPDTGEVDEGTGETSCTLYETQFALVDEKFGACIL